MVHRSAADVATVGLRAQRDAAASMRAALRGISPPGRACGLAQPGRRTARRPPCTPQGPTPPPPPRGRRRHTTAWAARARPTQPVWVHCGRRRGLTTRRPGPLAMVPRTCRTPRVLPPTRRRETPHRRHPHFRRLVIVVRRRRRHSRADQRGCPCRRTPPPSATSVPQPYRSTRRSACVAGLARPWAPARMKRGGGRFSAPSVGRKAGRWARPAVPRRPLPQGRPGTLPPLAAAARPRAGAARRPWATCRTNSRSSEARPRLSALPNRHGAPTCFGDVGMARCLELRRPQRLAGGRPVARRLSSAAPARPNRPGADPRTAHLAADVAVAVSATARHFDAADDPDASLAALARTEAAGLPIISVPVLGAAAAAHAWPHAVVVSVLAAWRDRGWVQGSTAGIPHVDVASLPVAAQAAARLE